MPVLETPDWECVVNRPVQIGEVPMWSVREDVLYWIDIRGPKLFRTDPRTGHEQFWTLPSQIGSFALHEDGMGAIVALQSGIFDLSFATGALKQLYEPPYETAYYRFNDGKCDLRGRFCVGSMRLADAPRPPGSAAFYRIDEHGMSPMFPGITVANGLAWSPDYRTMYIADSPTQEILAFDYDLETGEASNRRVFAKTGPNGRPDGAAVDTEGGYWVAMMRIGRILRFLPDGTLDRELRAPTTYPTMVAFGDSDLGSLYVTTCTHMYPSEEARRSEPLAGAVFRFRPGVCGIPEPGFAHTAAPPARA